jgi:alpha-L-rhamnosidase
MFDSIQKYCCILLLTVMFACENKAADFEVFGLSQNLPFEINKQQPLTFSWKIKSGTNNWIQGAYQLLVAGSEKNINSNVGDLWDSGKILSGDQLFIPYNSKPFVAGEKYYWKVKVWEKSGKDFKWSKVASFSTPLTYPQNWKASWITYDYKKSSPMPLLRKSFQLTNENKAISARLYICGLGYYEAYLNGIKIGDRVLEPAQTNYDDYAYYTAYDIPVKEILEKNTLGIMPGNGWYNQNQVWSPAMAYGQPIVIAQLIIKYKNGQSDTIITDPSWKWKEGPILFNNIYAGEVYDATYEVPGWCTFGSDEKDWKPAKLAILYPPKIVEGTMEPIRRMDELTVTRVLELSSKTWVYDFGQNFAGWVRLNIKGQKGQKITLRFAEEIDQNNNLDPTSTGVKATKCVQTDQYICKGEGVEVWEPRFTYHGFRYVEVTGLETKPGNDLLTGVVVYSSMKKAGEFSCSDPQINKLHEMALWTIKSNVHGIPTDCPHRERCGWTGDAHALATTLMQNFDARLFLTKYLYDMRSSARNTNKELYFGLSFQDRSVIPKPAGIPTMIVPGKRTSGIASPDWGTAVTQIPWQLYQHYDDINILREFYPDMKTWVDYISDKFPQYIVNHGLGDWCPPGGNAMIDCPVSVSSTAFHYLDLSILTKTAYLLGYTSDASYYFKRLNKVKEQFNEKFFDAAKNTYGSQTANALAIQIGLVPEGKASDVAKSISGDITAKSNGFIQTGIFGLGRIFPSLAENGAEDFAFNLFTKKGVHSFSHMWDKYGATTLWEILPVDNALSPETFNQRSHSHPMNAGCDEWFFRGIAGIHPDENAPGFKNIVFRPYFTSKLKNAAATYESPYGTISSKWNWEEKTFRWDVQIPANCGADIYIPKLFNNQRITINGHDDELNYNDDLSTPGFYVLKSVGSGIFKLKITDSDLIK